MMETQAQRAESTVRPAQELGVRVEDVVRAVVDPPLPFRITGYDGSDLGPKDAEVRFHVESPTGLRYLMTAPGDLGIARAFLTGHLSIEGIHPGDPYHAFELVKHLHLKRPSPATVARLARQLGVMNLKPPPAPEQEAPARWRRTMRSFGSRFVRAPEAISHHYDVSNAFYEKVLGPSMAYTCAVYADPSETLEQAQERKYELVCQKLALQPGMRLLDVGCGWGGMVLHAAKHHGVQALGVTLSQEQAQWAQAAIERDGLTGRCEVRHLDYAAVPENGFDAISSIGLTEHIGLAAYPGYFTTMAAKLGDGGRFLNHCITRPDSRIPAKPEAFTDRYVFPDGEIAAVDTVIQHAQHAGFEVQHVENLRMHYAATLAAWNRNLQSEWEFCVGEVGDATAKVWGLYMAGSRFAFESNWLQLHQVLFTRPGEQGQTSYPLRPDWNPTPT